jgi:hypothetical protein
VQKPDARTVEVVKVEEVMVEVVMVTVEVVKVEEVMVEVEMVEW